jgi:hypothetical protein
MSNKIFHGVGRNLAQNIDRWIAEYGEPVCFSDSDASKHYTRYDCAGGGGIEVLPLCAALERYPDHEIWITLPISETRLECTREIEALGVPLDRIGYFDGQKPMCPLKRMRHYLIDADATIADASLRLLRTNPPSLVVVDENNQYLGTLNGADIMKNEGATARDVCNRAATILWHGQNVYYNGRRVFLCRDFDMVPIIGLSGKVVDLLFRYQVFFDESMAVHEQSKIAWFPNMPYKHYAERLLMAASEAWQLGYRRISAIEFGVAGGNGLLHLERYAEEVERHYDFALKIDVYGFDSGEGLPAETDYRDIPSVFRKGFYKMNRKKLDEKCCKAQLVIGDFDDTLPALSKAETSPFAESPIAVMLIDCDYYSSTVPILKFLESSDELFLPRIYMYFDDLTTNELSVSEWQGENLAIKEFNERSKLTKISPEAAEMNNVSPWVKPSPEHFFKECHRFNHPKYGAVVLGRATHKRQQITVASKYS